MSDDCCVAGKPRGFETLRDMVWSMTVVGGVVLAIFAVVVWQRPEVQGDIRPSVDVEGLINQVTLTDPFPVEQPQDLPSGWTANSAWFESSTDWPGLDGVVMHVGYVTPSSSYAEVKQTNGDRDYAVGEWADDGDIVGVVDIDGRSWQRLESSATGKQALLLMSDRVDNSQGKKAPTVIVTGKADWPELEALAASLAPTS
jgi:hypothetical protein